MKKILAVVCVAVLVVVLSATQSLARRGHHHHSGGAALGVGGALLGLGILGLAVEEANRQQQEQVAQAAPCVRTAAIICNKCGFSETWQGEGNPPPPSCGCPSSYRWEWQ
jgi:hypothetical protein